jgi:oxidoreductase
MAAAAAAAAAAPEAAPAAAAVPLPPKPWRAAVLGATGACGRHVVGVLAKSADFESVTAFVRKRVEDGDLAARFYLESDAERAKVRQHALDFERMEEQKEAFQGYTHVFSCMGTT